MVAGDSGGQPGFLSGGVVMKRSFPPTVRVVFTLILLLFMFRLESRAGDCNQNGVEDRMDVVRQLDPKLPLRIPGDSSNFSVAAADLDGDGDQDLVVSHFLSLSILSNQGRGDFRETGVVTLELSPTGLVITDLNDDGADDLVVSAANFQAPHADVGVFVVLNRGDGTFRAPLRLLPEGGPRPPCVLDADLDGKPDLAVANQLAGSVSIFRNLGDESFADAVNVPVGAAPRCLRAAELDGHDGPDLALLVGDDRVVLLAGQDGFTKSTELYSQASLTDLGLADLDGDGLQDIVVSQWEGDRIFFLRNLDQGEFAPAQEFPTTHAPTQVLPVDLDADGASDLVVSGGSGVLTTMMNPHSGGLGASHDYYVGRLSGDAFAAADLDGDGDRDLAAALSTATSVVLVENLGEGRFAAPATVQRKPSERVGLLGAADLDGDGDPDLALTHLDVDRPQQMSILLLLNRGSGVFTPGAEVPLLEQLAKVDLLDVDGDGDRDIVVGQRSGFRGLVIYLNHGDATFDPPLNAVSTGYMSSFTSADFDGDGAPDLALPIEFPAGVEILRNGGGGKFAESRTLSWVQKTFSPPVFITVGDFTGDGLADVIVGPYDDLPARLYAGRGNFGFGTPVNLSRVSFSYNVANADLDGDGDVDLVSALNSKLSLYLNDGKGAFAVQVDYPTPPGPRGLEVADVDGDGSPDILLTVQGEIPPDLGEGELLIFVNDGQGGFARTLSLHPGYRPSEMVLADLDGDGEKDLMVMNEGWPSGTFPASLSFLTGLTRAPSSPDRDVDGIPDECQSLHFHRGDANEDGKLDVSDGLCMLRFLFSGDLPPPCLEAADANNDGRIDCTDPVLTLGYLFLGTDPPADPGPPAEKPCAADPDLKGEPGYLGCESYRPCLVAR